jgi:hypothetical protein
MDNAHYLDIVDTFRTRNRATKRNRNRRRNRRNRGI